jgi:hypothetical protein
MKINLKTIKLYILFIFAAISINSCNIFGIKGSGDTVTNVLSIENFDKIDLEIDADIEFIKSDIMKVEIVAQQNIFEVINSDVKSGKWSINYNKKVQYHKNITIYIYLSDIRLISISGSGSVYSGDTFTADEIEFLIPGSGDIDFLVDANDAIIDISGSGSVYLEGGTDNQNVEISGSGNYHGYNFFSKEAEIKLSGSGNCEVYTHDKLFAEISGSGNIYYKGSPTINSIITGSGNLINAN